MLGSLFSADTGRNHTGNKLRYGRTWLENFKLINSYSGIKELKSKLIINISSKSIKDFEVLSLAELLEFKNNSSKSFGAFQSKQISLRDNQSNVMLVDKFKLRKSLTKSQIHPMWFLMQFALQKQHHQIQTAVSTHINYILFSQTQRTCSAGYKHSHMMKLVSTIKQ